MSAAAAGPASVAARVIAATASAAKFEERFKTGLPDGCGAGTRAHPAAPSELANAGSKGRTIDEQGLNFMLSVIAGLEPRDEIEAMLGAQMAAVHMATMIFARRLAHVANVVQQDSAERAFNKLARTFAAQMEALKRYRTGGEQKVTVQHVTVNEGGQAVVGNVSAAPGRGGGEPKGGGQPHAQALAYASEPALRSQDPQQEPVSCTSDAERALPHARRSLAGRPKG